MPQGGELTGEMDRFKLPQGIRSRIAPTPSGYLHAGNALNFLLTSELVHAAKGTLLLRIDDLDADRSRPEYVDDIFRSLEWLGIEWDEGPTGPEDFERSWSQRHRVGRYHELLLTLRQQGHLYACTCSRKQLPSCACRDRGTAFDGPDRNWRVRLPRPCTVVIPEWPHAADPVALDEVMSDPVVRQRNGHPAYQITSLADDVDFHIGLIVRGRDLLSSTACQIHIAGELGIQDFARIRFVHHPLVTDAAGVKLSKSGGASSLKAMRESGKDAAELRAKVGRMMNDLLDQA